MSKDETPISDQLKQVIEELDIEGKARAAASAAEDAVFRGVGMAGQYVHEHRTGIEDFLDRATAAVERQTGGRYAEQVGRVREQLSAGVASLADRRWTPIPDDAAELEAPDIDLQAGDPQADDPHPGDPQPGDPPTA